MAPQVTILYNKSNTFGLQQDSILLQKILESQGFQIRVADPLEPQGQCDIAIHLEVPVYAAACLAAYNVFVINPEWWEEAWSPYLSRADLLIFKCDADKERFLANRESAKALTIPWTTPVQPSASVKPPVQKANSILWLLGGSVSKREAAMKVVPLWNAVWPELHVYTTAQLDVSGDNVKVHVKDLSESEIRKLQAEYPCHMIISASESLGLSALEGQAAGAFLIGNSLPVYQELFQGNPAVALIGSTLVPNKAGVKDTFSYGTLSELPAAINKYLNSDCALTYKTQTEAAAQRSTNFALAIADAFRSFKGQNKGQMAKPLQDSELPNISVITLLYNRRKFVDLAIHNLLITDYPKHKIEWVVVEDSDITEEQAADKVIKFGRESAPLSVSYIPMPSSKKIKNTIGAKRNLGIQRAQHEIILFMDDDDHYPDSSFRRRVSTLLTHPWKPKAAACTTIACYDLIKGTSAVNTPPWNLPLKQRISEATLVFYKSWAEKGFPDTNVAEGEGFLDGREGDVVELPPQQIIVAMSHSQNSTSRRIPGPSGRPSCFWGFPKEFLKWLHSLVDIEIE